MIREKQSKWQNSDLGIVFEREKKTRTYTRETSIKYFSAQISHALDSNNFIIYR